MRPVLVSHHHPRLDPQQPFGAAVVMTSILRPSLVAALRSVLAQHAPERIQVLVGIDRPPEDAAERLDEIAALCRDLPPRILVQLFWPGYSTAVRHGGLVAAGDGGALRTILTHLAHARHVAYLDDDNRWTPDHLGSLLGAVGEADYAFSLRWFVDPATGRKRAIDRWESVGPGEGVFAAAFGGFCDPNTLLIDRDRCREAVVAWCTPMPDDPSGLSADRMVFDRLRRLRGVGTGKATALYRFDPADGRHPIRLQQIAAAEAGRTV